MTAKTAEASTVHHPFGKPSGPGLFHQKGAQLPAYIQNIAHALVRKGMDESRAIAVAVSMVKKLVATSKDPAVKAAAAKALAEWEADKASAHAHASEQGDAIELSTSSVKALRVRVAELRQRAVSEDNLAKRKDLLKQAKVLAAQAAVDAAKASQAGAAAHKGKATKSAKKAAVKKAAAAAKKAAKGAAKKADTAKQLKAEAGYQKQIDAEKGKQANIRAQQSGRPVLPAGATHWKHGWVPVDASGKPVGPSQAPKAGKGKALSAKDKQAKRHVGLAVPYGSSADGPRVTVQEKRLRVKKARLKALAMSRRGDRVVDMSSELDLSASRGTARPHSRGDIYTHGWHLRAVSGDESKEAKHILASNNEGAGLDVHGRAYFGYVANPAPHTVAVRNQTGGIVGIHDENLDSKIAKSKLKEQSHLSKAQSATEPELKDAHQRAAQEHRISAMIDQAHQDYYHQTFKLDAQGVENFASPQLQTLAAGTGGKYGGFRTLQDGAAHADENAAAHLAEAQALVDRRKAVEATRTAAPGMTDAELEAAIQKTKDAKYGEPGYDWGGGNLMALLDERRKRNEAKSAKAKKLLDAPPSISTGFTPEEAKLIKSAADQTSAMSTEKMAAMLAKLTSRQAKTRKEQLQAEALRRALAKRGK